MRAALLAAGLGLGAFLAWRGAVFRPPAGRGGETSAPVVLLEEILRSRNDNDPRLDRGFDGLSAEAKRLFRRRYREFLPERRSERGMIVYVLGRNLETPEDWAFLREVVGEAPCLSLAGCSRLADSGPETAFLGHEVTLAYPALVALRQTRAVLERRDARDREVALSVVTAATASGAPIVARMAKGILDATGDSPALPPPSR